MNNRSNPQTGKTLIVILAVISIILLAYYAYGQLAPAGADQSGNDTDYDAGSTETVVASDSDYIIADDNTMEMDSIPNDAGVPSDTDE